MKPRAIIFSAPSGSGKTTIIKRLFGQYDLFEFSISATSRAPRGGECHGVDYYFLSPAEFQAKVRDGQFLEWEEVYADLYYGTLKSEIDRICGAGKVVVFDVDVNGGRNIKRYFGDDALALFIMPPSVEVLEQRLRGRGTDNEESIRKRLARAEQELAQAPQFDATVVNDDLERAVEEAKSLIDSFLQSNETPETV